MQSMTQQSLAGMTASRQKRPFPERRFLTKAVNKARAVEIVLLALEAATIVD
jgi:hypothetical protein